MNKEQIDAAARRLCEIRGNRFVYWHHTEEIEAELRRQQVQEAMNYYDDEVVHREMKEAFDGAKIDRFGDRLIELEKLVSDRLIEAMIDRSASNRSEEPTNNHSVNISEDDNKYVSQEPEPFRCKEHTMMVPVSLMISRATKVIERPTNKQVMEALWHLYDSSDVFETVAVLKEIGILDE